MPCVPTVPVHSFRWIARSDPPRRAMSTISRNDIRFLVLEGLMVLFGVFAALLLEGWREDAQARKEADMVVDRVLVEVRTNLDELRSLDSVVTYRLARLDSVAAGWDGGTSMAGVVGSFTGYRTPDLSSSAWQRLSTGPAADHVSVDLVQDGFELYSLHGYFSRVDDEISRLVYGEAFHDPVRFPYAAAISRRIMVQQVTWARQFIPRYEAFLDEHGRP